MKYKTPQYKRIEQDLNEKIASGYYGVGNSLPTEQELGKQYGVSRVTVRKALDNLVARDLLIRTPGVGTFVKQAPSCPAPKADLCGFTAEMEAMGRKTATELEVFEVIRASENIARLLEISEGALIYHFRRRRLADGRVLMLEDTFMSVDKYPDISIKVLTGSKYRYFEHVLGKKPVVNEQQILPVLATKEVAEIFGINFNTPILKIANVTRFADGEIMDYTEDTLNSPYYPLNYIKR